MRTMHNAKKHEDLIGPTREMLVASGKPYVIENVIGAPLIRPFMLCGTMFGLGTADGGTELRRYRIFETNFPVLVPQCRHGLSAPVIGLYGGHVRNRKRVIGIYGEGARDSRRKMDKGIPDFSVDDGRYAMGIPWMTIAELSQAIPPSYSKFIAESWLRSRALVAEEVTA
jgi:DNA (cytosine-5)-methyltransferase 1